MKQGECEVFPELPGLVDGVEKVGHKKGRKDTKEGREGGGREGGRKEAREREGGSLVCTRSTWASSVFTSACWI